MRAPTPRQAWSPVKRAFIFPPALHLKGEKTWFNHSSDYRRRNGMSKWRTRRCRERAHQRRRAWRRVQWFNSTNERPNCIADYHHRTPTTVITVWQLKWPNRNLLLMAHISTALTGRKSTNTAKVYACHTQSLRISLTIFIANQC